MKKFPVGIDMFIKDGLAMVDFSCPDCGKKYEDVVVGGINEPEECECGCELHKIRFSSPNKT